MTSMEVTSATSTPSVANNMGLPQKIALAGMRFLTDAMIKKYFPNQEKNEVFKFFSAAAPETVLLIGEAFLQAKMKPTAAKAATEIKNPDDMKDLEAAQSEVESTVTTEKIETTDTTEKTETAEKTQAPGIARATLKKVLKLAYDNL